MGVRRGIGMAATAHGSADSIAESGYIMETVSLAKSHNSPASGAGPSQIAPGMENPHLFTAAGGATPNLV